MQIVVESQAADFVEFFANLRTSRALLCKQILHAKSLRILMFKLDTKLGQDRAYMCGVMGQDRQTGSVVDIVDMLYYVLCVL